MPSVKKYHSNNWDLNFNLLLPAMVLVSLYTNVWLWVNDISTGVTYGLLYLAFAVTVALVHMFSKGDQLTRISDVIKAPFAVSNALSAASWLAGSLLALGLEFVLSAVTNFSITAYSVPLFAQQLTSGIFQNFSQAEISQSLAWTIFNVGFNSGISEEILFSLGAMLFGAMFGMVVLIYVFNGKAPFGIKDKDFIVIQAILIASALFTFLHVLNGSYAGMDYLYAFLFKLATLIGIYYLALFVIFTAGFHVMNNIIWIIQEYGLAETLNAMISWQGGVIAFFYVVPLIYVLLNFDTVIEEFSEYLRS